jgi:nitrogen fixation protein NifX
MAATANLAGIHMSQLSRDIALRIALASRVLPGVDIQKLITVLHAKLGSPLDDEKLKSITVTNLKTGIGSHDGEEDGEDIGIGLENIKLAVRYLWGDETGDEGIPQVQPYREGDLPESIRVAIASNASNLLNGHFGSCIRFLVYQLSRNDMRLIDIRSTIEADSADDRNLFRANLIKDCQVLFVQSIGGPAAAKVIRADIYPIKEPDVFDAIDKLTEFQKVFDAPPPWMAKILGKTAEERKRFNYDEDWDETTTNTDSAA